MRGNRTRNPKFSAEMGLGWGRRGGKSLKISGMFKIAVGERGYT